ncbi:MMPL family transporter [Actinacidiphila paucisporea]|uniref:Putative drug exporter of the RND superfamily n=1 Tax=Actinacidiphila paucisporea TaxID=310782 RepID=A0A1M7PMI6_9ACTN|nr:MMPL family transporter [Actinacidiphila paucisporea]SHN18514.1 putative drug exporter of the RND superfamily [Actinacidiphila paucisporea]
MLTTWGRLLVRFRWAAIAAGIAVVLVGGAWGGGVFNTLKSGGFDDPNSESGRASARIAAELGARDVDVVVLYSSPTATVDDPAFAGAVRSAVARLHARPEIANIATYADTHLPSLRSRDGHSTGVLITLKSQDQDIKSKQYKDIRDDLAAPGLTKQVGGVVPLAVVTDDMAKKDISKGEMIAFPALLVLLTIIFGGVVAAGMPLLVGILAILGAFTATRVITEFTDVSTFAVNTITLLGLGLAIDYSLLIVSRYRKELLEHEPAEAIARTMATAGRTVLVSGLTVVLALSSLLIFPLVFLRSIGFGGMSAVFVAMLSALTVLPAMLAVLGRRINSWRVPLPGRRRREAAAAEGGGGSWERIAHTVMRRPVLYTVGVLVILGVFAAPFMRVHFAGSDERVLPKSTEARVVSERLAADFPGGSEAPMEVYVGHATAAQLQDVSARIDKVPGVTDVKVAAQRGTSTMLTVGYQGERTGDTAYDAVRGIRALDEPAGVQVLVGGRPAMDVDRLATLGDGLPWMLGIMAAATFVLLFLAFGSVVLPLVAVVMNLVSIGASFGVIIWIFQQGHLSGMLHFTPTGFLEPTVPVLILATLYGLATDYELFLVSAIREAWPAGADGEGAAGARKAIAGGLQRTGRIITAAALLLGVVDAGFSTSGIVFTKMIGIGMVIALIVDATLVRVVLMPAVLRLLGRSAWWAPGPLAKLHGRVGVSESDGPEPRVEESDLV